MIRRILVLVTVMSMGLLWTGCGNEVVVTVNDKQFTREDLDKEIAIRKLVSGEEAIPKADSPQYADFEKKAVYAMMMSYVIGQEAPRMNITVSDAEVDALMRTLTNQYGGNENLDNRLKDNGISRDDLVASRRNDLTFQKVFTEVTMDAPVVTDEEALLYYNQHKNEDDFRKPETRNIHLIFVPTEALANQAQARLNAGEDFATVAREMSTDQATKGNGGERTAVPVLNSGLPAEAEQVMGELAVGQVSDPVKSGFGYYIIRLDSINPREQTDFEEIREQLKQQLQMTGASRDFFDAWLAGVTAGYNIVYSEKYQPVTTTTS